MSKSGSLAIEIRIILSCRTDEPNSSLPVAMSGVSCLVSATRLQDCTFSGESDSCSRLDDIGLTCSDCTMYLCSDGECTDATTCNDNAECADGSDESDIICGQLESEMIAGKNKNDYTVTITLTAYSCGHCVQWNLRTKDTLGPTIVSIVERMSSSRRFQSVLLQWELLLGHYEVSFMRGCPFLRGSFIRGSTVEQIDFCCLKMKVIEKPHFT